MTQHWHESPPPWHHQSQPHGLETEHRLTKLEVRTDDHGHRLKSHAELHQAQDLWNKGFSIALIGVSAGLAHAKAGEVMEFLFALYKGLKP